MTDRLDVDARYAAKISEPSHPLFGLVGTCCPFEPDRRGRRGRPLFVFPDGSGGFHVGEDEIEAVSEATNA